MGEISKLLSRGNLEHFKSSWDGYRHVYLLPCGGDREELQQLVMMISNYFFVSFSNLSKSVFDSQSYHTIYVECKSYIQAEWS